MASSGGKGCRHVVASVSDCMLIASLIRFDRHVVASVSDCMLIASLIRFDRHVVASLARSRGTALSWAARARSRWGARSPSTMSMEPCG